MPTILDFWCRLFGYSSCHALSTFEAIILAVMTAVIILVFAVVAWVVHSVEK